MLLQDVKNILKRNFIFYKYISIFVPHLPHCQKAFITVWTF